VQSIIMSVNRDIMAGLLARHTPDCAGTFSLTMAEAGATDPPLGASMPDVGSLENMLASYVSDGYRYA
jgi:hypothetical protein